MFYDESVISTCFRYLSEVEVMLVGKKNFDILSVWSFNDINQRKSHSCLVYCLRTRLKILFTYQINFTMT